MILENKTDKAIIDEVIKHPALGYGPIEARTACDDEFMKKNNITHESHELQDFGLEYDLNTEGELVGQSYVTKWIPRN